MPRDELLRACVTAIAIALAAIAVAGCQGRLSLTDAPERSTRVQSSRRDPTTGAADREERPSATEAADEEAVDLRADDAGTRPGTDGAAQEPSRGEERAGGDADGSMQAHGSERPSADLEFSAGLPEPPQQQLLPPPAPWTPPPCADASGKPLIEDVWPDKAPASGGERVVIRGRNLAPAQVFFGFVPARILRTSESQDELTVVAPASDAGQVAIVVTNRDGNYAVVERAFRYYP